MPRRFRRIKVSVVVPAHNEEGNIDKLLTAFDDTFRESDFSAEVLLVDDGSTDNTGRRIAAGARRYHFVRRLKNRVRMGLTAALSKGFNAAKGEILVFYPADLQFHPRDIPRMITAIDNGADMICGKKVGQYGKWLVSKLYNVLTRMLFPRLKVSDMNSVKAFRREIWQELPTLREGWHRYLPVFAASKGYMVREVPVTLDKRHSGKSKFSGKGRILKGLTDLIAVKFQLSVLGDPMHLFGRLALLLFVLGVVVAAAAFYMRFGLGIGYRPMLYVVILFEISALITFIMGIIIETLVYLRDSLTDAMAANRQLSEKVDKLSSTIASLSKAIPRVQRQEQQTGGRNSHRPKRHRPAAAAGDSGRRQEIRPRPLPDDAVHKQDDS